MRITLALIAALAAALYSASTWAQSLADICATVELPTRAEYESNTVAYADNFCALATYAPHRAASQLDKTVSLVRATNNPNRFYFDPKVEPDAAYIQLLRPWMVEQGGWRIRQLQDDPYLSLTALLISPFGNDQNLELLLRPFRSLGSDLEARTRHQYIVEIVGRGSEPYSDFSWYVLADEGNTLFFSREDYGDPDVVGDILHPTGDQVTALVHNALDCLGATVPDSIGGTYWAAFLFTRGEQSVSCQLP